MCRHLPSPADSAMLQAWSERFANQFFVRARLNIDGRRSFVIFSAGRKITGIPMRSASYSGGFGLARKCCTHPAPVGYAGSWIQQNAFGTAPLPLGSKKVRVPQPGQSRITKGLIAAPAKPMLQSVFS